MDIEEYGSGEQCPLGECERGKLAIHIRNLELQQARVEEKLEAAKDLLALASSIVEIATANHCFGSTALQQAIRLFQTKTAETGVCHL